MTQGHVAAIRAARIPATSWLCARRVTSASTATVTVATPFAAAAPPGRTEIYLILDNGVATDNTANMKRLVAFHGDAKKKTFYLKRLARHRAAGRLVQVGCTLESYEHSRYPVELGIPEREGQP